MGVPEQLLGLVVVDVVSVDSKNPLLSLSPSVDFDHEELLVLRGGNRTEKELVLLPVGRPCRYLHVLAAPYVVIHRAEELILRYLIVTTVSVNSILPGQVLRGPTLLMLRRHLQLVLLLLLV